MAPGYLLIALLPTAVFLLTTLLLHHVGDPSDIPPTHFAEFDAHKEAAARLGTIAAFVLFAGAAGGSMLFFVWTCSTLDWPSFWAVMGTFVALIVATALLFVSMGTREPQDYLGPSLVCTAAGYDATSARTGSLPQSRADPGPAGKASAAPRPVSSEAAGKAARAASTTAASPESDAPTGVAVSNLRVDGRCSGRRFSQLRSLFIAQIIIVILAGSCLVLGAICCLGERVSAPLAGGADPVPTPAPDGGAAAPAAGGGAGEPAGAPSPPPDPDLLHYEEQSKRLNSYLYASALLLGSGLLFVSAGLSWPQFALTDPAGYEAHAQALTTYYGFSYTVVLASFYLPVAGILSGKVRKLNPVAPGESKLPEAFKGAFQILKIALALLSTSVAGVLTQFVDFGL